MTLLILNQPLSAANPRVLADSILELFPWLPDVLLFLATLILLLLMAWFMRGGRVGNGFVIHVNESDITFTGKFPPNMQATVIEFLRHDVALPGSYQIRGHWESPGSSGEGSLRTSPLLIIVVKGDQARPMEQRIRNFLKLNLKPPR